MTVATPRHTPNRRQAGMTLVEILVALAVLAVLLVPAVTALNDGLAGTAVQNSIDRDHYRLLSRMESVLAEGYADLEAAVAGTTVPTTYSDDAGTPERLLVYIAGYDADDADGDGDPFTGADDGILWIRAEIEGSSRSLDSLAVR